MQNNPLRWIAWGFVIKLAPGRERERHKQHSLGSQRRSASWRISSLGRRFGQNRQHQAILEVGWVGGHLARDTDLIVTTRGERRSDERNRAKDRPHDQQLGHRNLPGRGLRRRAIFIIKIVGDGEFGEYSRLQPVEKGAPLCRRPCASRCKKRDETRPWAAGAGGSSCDGAFRRSRR